MVSFTAAVGVEGYFLEFYCRSLRSIMNEKSLLDSAAKKLVRFF